MGHRYYTFMLIPDESKAVKKISFPSWTLKVLLLGACLLVLVSGFVFFDYLHILSQVAENKQLRYENTLLRRDVNKVQNEMETLSQSVGRLKSFAHKIQALVNLGEPGSASSVEATPYDKKGDEFEADTPVNEAGLDLKEETPLIHPDEDKKNEEYLKGLVSDFQGKSLKERVFLLRSSSEQVHKIAKNEEQRLARLHEGAQDQAQKLRYTPSLIPSVGWISSRFGFRRHPVTKRRAFHNGIDIANMPGTPVRAPADGKVQFAGNHGALGKTIKINHGYKIVTRYGHLSRLRVKRGQKVKRGQLIGNIGNTGRSTGPHLHYQVEVNRRPVNPKYFILEKF